MASSVARPSIDFCTLGMFILDDIHPPPTAASQAPRKDVLGGAGTYAAIGARLLSPPPSSKTIGWIVDAGTDWSPALTSAISAWDTSVFIRARTALTTRGWNGYSGNEHRSFHYLTEKKLLTADDLSPELMGAKSFHLICSARRCVEQVNGILTSRREQSGRGTSVPLFTWEPVPDLCTPEELVHIYAALSYVDIISPNHDELGAMFGFQHGEQVDSRAVEHQAQQMSRHGIGREGNGAIVVRCGAMGVFIQSRTISRWLPAWHTDASKVLDPTGAGNGFLGGLAVGLVRTNFDVVEAARWGSIAASFCVEQVGMPQLVSATEPERWNGVCVSARLADFRQRTM